MTFSHFVLLQNKHTTLAENVENLISAQPRISAHLEPCFVTFSHFVLLQNKHTTLAENVENLISAQPRISAHLE